MKYYRVYKKYWIEEYYECKSGGGWIFTLEADAVDSRDKLNADSNRAFELCEEITENIEQLKGELKAKLGEPNIVAVPKGPSGNENKVLREEKMANLRKAQDTNAVILEKYYERYAKEVTRKVDSYKEKMIAELGNDIPLEKLKSYLERHRYIADEYEYEVVEFVK